MAGERDSDDEIKAMANCARQLSALDVVSRDRVMTWLLDRFKPLTLLTLFKGVMKEATKELEEEAAR